MTSIFGCLCLLACSFGPSPDEVAPEPRNLTILAMNDWHGALYEAIDPEQEGWAYGGLPWFVASIDHLKKQHQHVMLVDGGDAFQGTWPINSSQGSGSVDVFSLLGVSAASVGNHEFDYGPSPLHQHPLRGALRYAAQKAPFPWLAANIYMKTASGETGERWTPEGITPWALVEQDGFRVAIIGLSTQETPTTTRSTYVQDLVFTDPVVAVQELLPEIEAANPDALIVTGHLTGSCKPKSYMEPEAECLPDGEIGRLLTELPRGTIDVIVAGHEHTLLSQRVGDTFVLESRHKGHAITGVSLSIGEEGVITEGSRLLPVFPVHHPAVRPGCDGGSYPRDPITVNGVNLSPSEKAIELVASLEHTSGSLCEVVGCADEDYITDREKASPLGALVSQAMMETMPEALVAVTNAGGLRANLSKGTIRREDIHAVMPFDNELVLVEVPGDDLKLLFEIGTSGAHGMLQVAGAQLTLHPSKVRSRDLNKNGSKEQWESSRLCTSTIGGRKLRKSEWYPIVTTDFLLTGGDHLGPAFSRARIIKEGPSLRDAIIDYVKAQGECLPSPAPEDASSPIQIEKCTL